MFIPLRTEVDSPRPALITPALVLTNGLILLGVLLADQAGVLSAGAAVEFGSLKRGDFHWWQPFTYQFLHDTRSLWHLLMNMLFLWVFGSAVEGRLGRLGFLAFYLAGGVVAGMAHMAFSVSPVIGASGAVAGCSGAFLALFPRAHVRVLMVFFLIGVFRVPAAFFILLYVAIDLVSQFTSFLGVNPSRVAYAAHLAGYAYGFGLAFLLLATRRLPRKDFDVFFLFTQARRRAAMRAAVREGAKDEERARARVRLANAAAKAPPPPPERLDSAAARSSTGRSLPAPPEPAPPRDEATTQARAAVEAAIASRDFESASARYRDLLARDSAAILSYATQMDVANQLLRDGDNLTAARAYELFIKAYPESPRADEARLLLATIYTRRLPDPVKARSLLDAIRATTRPGRGDEGYLALAAQLRLELPS